jgi:hypothetical protein
MAKAEINAGACGFKTVVVTHMEGNACKISIQSDCKAIIRLGEALTEVNPYQEISFRREGPLTLRAAAQYCSHTACPVPSGIIKAIEVEAGLNLPVDVSIKLSKTDE